MNVYIFAGGSEKAIERDQYIGGHTRTTPGPSPSRQQQKKQIKIGKIFFPEHFGFHDEKLAMSRD